jgi:hypothetical protein
VQTLIAQSPNGRLDPQAYAAGRMQLARDFGVSLPNPGADMQGAIAWANSVNQYLDAGGRTIPTNLTMQQVATAAETMGNNLVNNPVGAALVGAGNAASMGAVEALMPGEVTALRDAQGGASTLGEIGGAIASTAGLGALGRMAAGRVAPQLLQGGARGQFARNVATDAAYGAGYGMNTEGDPLTGAALGTLGSVAGQGVARGLGAGIGGMQRSAAAELLRNRGVPVSVARQVGLGRVEDVMQSLPLAGDVSRARQLDSFEGLNRTMMEEGGQSIGFTPTRIGRDGVDDFEQAVSDAYTQATQGAVAPIDTQFYRDLRPAMQAIRGLPDDYRAAAETIMERRVEPAIAGGNLTGEQFQQAIRGIRQARANAGRNPSLAGFDQEYRDALTGVEDLLTGTMTRGAGPEVAADLAAANAANRGLKVSENAILDRAAVGTQAGAVNVATPAQWLSALRQSERRGFGDNAGMRQIAEAGQEVLPSTVPNSGTADRMMALGLLGGAGALGGGAGFANAPQDQGIQGAASGAGTGLGTLAATSGILALLGTRGGQRALEQILITRPQVAQRAGQGVRRSGGLFGRSGASLALQGY